ncbi:hypothetical protein ACN081_02195 [Rothia sp. P13129]|uniref:hypothetical protein n=1 Tax=Rothia sp. P13129 TaxID=3402664 RepID=UPI003ACFCE0F
MAITQYLLEKAQVPSVLQLALKTGVPHHKLNNQLTGRSTLTLETLRDISLATGLDFLDLAVKAELITQQHAKNIRAKGALLNATNNELINELKRRLDQGENLNQETPIFSTPTQLAEDKHWRENIPTAEDMQYHIGTTTPDGTEFRPDLYTNHKMLWDRYGQQWQEHYTLAAKKQEPFDDIEEQYE